MENTIIIKKDGEAINSKDCRSFHLNVRMTQKAVKLGDKPQSQPYSSRIELVAHTFEDKIEVISRFSIDDACNALLSLLKAIGIEKVWDVKELHSDEESSTGVTGTEVAPSGGKIEKEPTDIQGTVVKPSTC